MPVSINLEVDSSQKVTAKSYIPTPPITTLSPEQIAAQLRARTSKEAVGIPVPNPARIVYELKRLGFVGPTKPSLAGLRRGLITGLL